MVDLKKQLSEEQVSSDMEEDGNGIAERLKLQIHSSSLEPIHMLLRVECSSWPQWRLSCECSAASQEVRLNQGHDAGRERIQSQCMMTNLACKFLRTDAHKETYEKKDGRRRSLRSEPKCWRCSIEDQDAGRIWRRRSDITR